MIPKLQDEMCPEVANFNSSNNDNSMDKTVPTEKDNNCSRDCHQMDMQHVDGKKSKKTCYERLLERFGINKSLLQLKISLFLFFGAGASIAPFFQVYFKQRGLTISQLSIIYIINPSVQFLGPTISGLIADKTGRSKPVLLANMGLATVFLTAMLFIPDINKQNCLAKDVNVTCANGIDATVDGLAECESVAGMYRMHDCKYHCVDNNTFTDFDGTCPYVDKTMCEDRFVSFNQLNFSLVQIISTHNTSRNCSYNVISHLSDNKNASWCQLPFASICTLRCVIYYIDGIPKSEECQSTKDNSILVFACSFLLLIFFSTMLSNCYRFMDVTSMAMVKTHNSDFGKQRFWSILSAMLLSPLAGYLVGITSPEGGPKNCSMAFYMFDGMMILAMISVWKLDVRITPPGEKMWMKSLSLLKNPDVMVFTAALVVLGTSWGFTKVFSYLYLDSLNAPSLLLGIIQSVNSLVGLPFLLTSNWWVKKIGSVNLVLLGLVAYALFCVGYSFLVNPWYALVVEVFSIFSYHLLWVAVVRHCHEMSPEGLTSTIIALAGGIHYAIGKGSGSLIGGQIMGAFGGRWAYRVIASICSITFLLYGGFLLTRRKKTKKIHLDEDKNSIKKTFAVEMNAVSKR